MALPYFLHLNYFEGKDPLLVIGTHTVLRKEFIAKAKTNSKQDISYGNLHLDINGMLKFVPQKNGMNVKPRPIVAACKNELIKKSNQGFWSTRTINNIIITELPKVEKKEQLESNTTQDNSVVETTNNVDLASGKAILEGWLSEGLPKVQNALKAKPKQYEQALSICTAQQNGCQTWLMVYKDASKTERLKRHSTYKKLKKLQLQVGSFIVKITDMMEKDQLMGEVSPVENATYSEIYKSFKQFKELDYEKSTSTRNAEYYAVVMHQLDDWIRQLKIGFKQLKEKEARQQCKVIHSEIAAFKALVKEAAAQNNQSSINEEVEDATVFKQAFEKLLEEYKAIEDSYEESIKEAEIRRVLHEYEESNKNDKQARLLKQGLEAVIWLKRVKKFDYQTLKIEEGAPLELLEVEDEIFTLDDSSKISLKTLERKFSILYWAYIKETDAVLCEVQEDQMGDIIEEVKTLISMTKNPEAVTELQQKMEALLVDAVNKKDKMGTFVYRPLKPATVEPLQLMDIEDDDFILLPSDISEQLKVIEKGFSDAYWQYDREENTKFLAEYLLGMDEYLEEIKVVIAENSGNQAAVKLQGQMQKLRDYIVAKKKMGTFVYRKLEIERGKPLEPIEEEDVKLELKLDEEKTKENKSE